MINLKLLLIDSYREIVKCYVKPFLYIIKHFAYCAICVSPLLYASMCNPKNYYVYIFGFIGSLFMLFIMTTISKYRKNSCKYKN